MLHAEGKKHLANVKFAEHLWANFNTQGGREVIGGDQVVEQEELTNSFLMDELKQLPMRESCLDTHTTLSDVSPSMRMRIWRYLYSVMSMESESETFSNAISGVDTPPTAGLPFSPSLPRIFFAMEQEAPHFLRVKEIFEAAETFALVQKFVAAQGPRCQSIFDLGCGNGLLGILCAYRFPDKRVVCLGEWAPSVASVVLVSGLQV
jgi:hypothetical protein